jgi:hypothetical protein
LSPVRMVFSMSQAILALSLAASTGTISDETDLRMAPSAWCSCRSVASPVSTASQRPAPWSAILMRIAHSV